MGRAKLRVADALCGVILADGTRETVPIEPLRDAQIIDARYKDWCIELLLSGPRLTGSEKDTLDTAPDVSVAFRRIERLTAPAGEVVTLQLTRIADRRCTCDGAVGLLCASCLASSALEHMPLPWREAARAVRSELGETVPAPDAAEIPDSPPGA